MRLSFLFVAPRRASLLRYVCYHNSELMCGNLAKKTLGDGSKTGLFYTLIREHGPLEAAR